MAKSILLLGATGFIGSEIARMLAAEGHRVTGLGRDIEYGRRILPAIDWRRGDLRHLASAGDWSEMLAGCDIVINASGALQSGLRDQVDQVQYRAIAALIEACTAAKVSHFVQISASNADPGQGSDFMESKARADALLSASGLSHTILRPGLVIGRNAFGGTEMVRMAAALPAMIAVPAGTGAIQCLALSDLLTAVGMAVRDPAKAQGRFDLVETGGHSLAGIFAAHRQWLGFAAPRWQLTLPRWALRPLTAIADMLGWMGWRSPLRSNSIAALMNGVSGDASETERLLGHPPLDLAQILSAIPAAGKADRWHARIALAYPMMLVSLFLLWLGSGLLGLVKTDEAAALLVPQMQESTARALVLAGSVADIAIAFGLLFRPWLKSALLSSLALTAAYWAGAFLFRPDLWLDPLAPMLKTIPAFALALACLAMADER